MAPLPESPSSPLDRLVARTSSYLTSHLPSAVTTILSKRETNNWDKSAGTTPVNNIPNTVVFVLFGLIGAGFVITGIWFFFFAKNGGFYFKEGDWDDYKSTVLRRKGPNGTTLSGATASTDLGGGSVVGKRQRQKRYKDVESSIGTESEMSELKSERGERKKGKKSKRANIRDEESVIGDREPEEAIRAYRHEKPARVGGLNRAADGSAFEGSTADSHSDLLSHRQHTPTNSPAKNKLRKDNYTGGSGASPGIRKVESTSGGGGGFWNRAKAAGSNSKQPEMKESHIASEARKLQEKGRAAGSGRRDFSYTAGDDMSSVGLTADDERRQRRASRSPRVPGSYAESDVGSDATGTKAYHHPIPGLASGGGYAEERRKLRAERAAGGGGYRRGGGGDDDLD
jgi:hypothetical protein